MLNLETSLSAEQSPCPCPYFIPKKLFRMKILQKKTQRSDVGTLVRKRLRRISTRGLFVTVLVKMNMESLNLINRLDMHMLMSIITLTTMKGFSNLQRYPLVDLSVRCAQGFFHKSKM